MNLKHLQTFLVLSETKSFTKAASILGIAQSGATTHIRLLEEALGARLFERMGKRVFLTAKGELLLPYAKKMLSLSAELAAVCQNFEKLTLGVAESIANYLLPDIIKEFSTLSPDAEIFLKITDEKDYAAMLIEGEIDLAMVLDLPVQHKSIKVLGRRKENILLAASSTHKLAGANQMTAEDFKTCPALLPLPSCPYRKLFEQKLLSFGIRPKIALETSSCSLIKESSLCGAGLGLLPEFAVKKELVYHMLEKIPYGMDYPMYTQILMHEEKRLSAAQEQFLEIALRHLS